MQEVYKAIGRVAPQDVTVLILGESGTGKELVARAIYQHSRRAAGPFLAINCAAIPETLLESELFGHEKGAFTGADRRRIGKFEQCHGGTLFLDEIGDMTPLTQTKVLRVLQEQQFERVGGNETIQTDVRADRRHQPRPGSRWSPRGQFRNDLYYRLNVFTIQLPPLRERAEDLPGSSQHFLQRFSRELGKEVQAAPPEAMAPVRSATPGRATCASCKASSSRRCSTRPGRCWCRTFCLPPFRPACRQNSTEWPPPIGTATCRNACKLARRTCTRKC